MLEPDVAITDYILAVQCLCFTLLIYRTSIHTPWFLLFGSLSAASLTGGTVHGFLPDKSSLAYVVLWRATLISIGALALAGWYVGSAFLKNKQMAGWVRRAAIVQFFLFCMGILFYSQQFYWRRSITFPRLVSCLLFLCASILLQKKSRRSGV